jgi:hypothetical protein
MWLTGQVGDLRRNVGIEAARTNFNDLLRASGLQLQGEQALAQQLLAQQQFEQGLYNQDLANYGRIFDSMDRAGQSAYGTQLNLLQSLNALFGQGQQAANPYLNTLGQYGMWQIQPNPIAQAPIQTSGPPVPFYAGGYGGGGGQGGGSGVNWAPLVQAGSYWAGSQM